jgi:chlorite dismutase
MNRPPGPATDIVSSLIPEEGWHCTHLFYQFDRRHWAEVDPAAKEKARIEFCTIVDPVGPQATERMQVSIVSGHKADFALMLMDPDPLKIDRVHQALLNSTLGPALIPTYSFVSVSEISEYVPTVEQYGDRLVEEGVERGSPAFEAKLNAYRQREPIMRRQRLTPDFPDWPATCFYPMNKKRKVGENWFLLPYEERHRMMAEHAKSGMMFAGRVTQLITVSVGLDDWEWGVTLWAKNPAFLKDIVYKMRFDEASARYAEFGPFYTSYVVTANEVWDHCFPQARH